MLKKGNFFRDNLTLKVKQWYVDSVDEMNLKLIIGYFSSISNIEIKKKCSTHVFGDSYVVKPFWKSCEQILIQEKSVNLNKPY